MANEDGRIEYPQSAFVDAVENHNDPTTTDVAESIGCSQQVAHYRLEKLEEEGKVASRKVGRARVWSLSSVEDSEP